MLVTNPSARASLSEVLNHPWMTRGYRGPPDSHLVHREPLRADELDRNVIKGMKGFEFGTEEEIEQKLVEVLESDAYYRAVQHWERKRMSNGRNGHRWGESFSNSSLAISYDGSSTTKVDQSPSKKSKRFSGFDFYRRKLFSPSSSPPSTPLAHSPPSSQSHLSNSSLLESAREPADPTYGFHPLVSIYFLVREKLEREKVYGPGQFASSQLSLEAGSRPEAAATDVPAPPTSAKQLSQPSVRKRDPPISGKPDYSMPLPRLPAPETSHYSGLSYDVTPATPSPTTSSFPQPRARDAALSPTKVPQSPALPRAVAASPARMSMSMSMPREPATTAHRRSHSLSQRPSVRGWHGMFGLGGADEMMATEQGTLRPRKDILEPPRTAGPEFGTFAEKMDAPREVEERQSEEEPRTPLLSAGATLVRKFGSILGGRADDSRRAATPTKRGSILTSFSPRPSGEGDVQEKEKNGVQFSAEPEKTAEGAEEEAGQITQSQSQPVGSIHRHAATILDPSGRSTRHERRSSTGAALMSQVGGTIGRHRRPSTGNAYGYSKPLGERLFGKTEEEDEQQTANEQSPGENGAGEVNNDEALAGEDKEFKPVYLKGLFRYACPSSSDA